MPSSRPTAWCETVGPRTAASSAPSSATSATSVFEFPPSTARTTTAPISTGVLSELVDAHVGNAIVAGAGEQPLDDDRRHRRPAVEQHHRSVADAPDPLADAALQPFGRRAFRPVLAVDVPPHVPVAGRRDRSEHPRIRCPVAERAAEPRPRVHAAGLADRLFGAPDVVSDALVGEMRHPPVVVAVTADHVAAFHQCAAPPREPIRPSGPAGRTSPVRRSREHLEQPLGSNRVRAIGVLRIERQCHPHCHAEKPTSRRR